MKRRSGNRKETSTNPDYLHTPNTATETTDNSEEAPAAKTVPSQAVDGENETGVNQHDEAGGIISDITPVQSCATDNDNVHVETIESSNTIQELNCAASRAHATPIIHVSHPSLAPQGTQQQLLQPQGAHQQILPPVCSTSTLESLQTIDPLQAQSITSLPTSDNPATLLYLLNASHFNPSDSSITSSTGVATTTGSHVSLPSASTAVFVPHVITAPPNTVFIPQAASGNANPVFMQQAVSGGTGDANSNNVIEKAMDLANLGDMSSSDCMQHPLANAALTLVSLGSAAQLTHEVVIDESGNSSYISSPAVEGPSITVESTDESPAQVNNTQTQSIPQDIAPETAIPDPGPEPQSISPDIVPAPQSVSAVITSESQTKGSSSEPGDTISSNPPVVNSTSTSSAGSTVVYVVKKHLLREVTTQTGGGNTEVIVANTIDLNKAWRVGGKRAENPHDEKTTKNQGHEPERTRDHECLSCGKKYYTKNDLKRHTVTHSSERPYICQECEKAFRTSNELKLHMAIHVTGTPYKCEYCGKEFRTKGCIKSHIKYHTGDKRHKCTICDRAFVKSADLKRHVAAHNNEKNYKCSDCGAAFTRRDNLKAHVLLHSREGVVTCDLCDKEFINQVYLKRHMHIHKQAKKKPYECQWCPKTYEQLDGLNRHIRQHVGDEKFVCEHCSKKFITAIQLKRHLWLSHEQGSPYRRSIL